MTVCSMASITLTVLFTVLLVSINTIAIAYSTVSVDWFVSDDFSVGIASGCPAHNVTHIGPFEDHTITITYCSGFEVTHLRGWEEKVMASCLLVAITLGLCSLYNLIFALFTRIGSTNIFLLGLQFVLLVLTVFLFAEKYGFVCPDDTHVGPSYVVAMCTCALSFITVLICRWINRRQKGEYTRID
eukprot:CFRG1807T1